MAPKGNAAAVAAIPAELRRLDQWVCWQTERRNGKVTKVPYQVNGNLAASNKPSTWTTFENVSAAAELFDGIGLVLAADDPLTGGDLDDCLTDNGELHPEALRIIETLDSYTEWSPSGTGVRIFVEATKPAGGCKTGKTPWGGKLEIYDRGRFLTVTGDRLPRLPRSVAERQEQLARVHAEFFPAHMKREQRGDDHRHGHAARSVEKLLEAHPRLEQLARRKGKQPGDGSASDWDFTLGCTARREASASHDEVAELIRYSRGLHGDAKGERRDYVARTTDAVLKAVPLAREGATPENLGHALGERWNLDPADPIVGGELIGPGADAIVRLERRSGQRLRFESLRALFSARTHSRVVSVETGTRFPAVTEKEAVDLAQQVIQICRKAPVDAADLAEAWLGNFYESAGATVDGSMQTTEERRATLLRRRAAEAELDLRGDVASRTAVVRDEEGDVWIPAGALRANLSPGAPTWRQLEASVAEVGWRRVKVELWPNPGRQDRGRKIKVVFFVGRP